MTDKNLSQSDASIVYQVIASRIDDESGYTLRARLGSRPFLIGSDKKADLLLADRQIIPIHARLLVSTSRQVMLNNLGGDNTVFLNGEGIAAYTPVVWKPGIPVRIGSFELQLVTLSGQGEPAQVERVRPALITQTNEPAVGPFPPLVIDWGEPPEPVLDKPSDGTVLFDDEDTHVDATRPGLKAPEPALPAPSPSDQQASDKEDVIDGVGTDIMPFTWEAMPDILAAQTGIDLMGTLPKNWKSGGVISAQLTINPVNLVAGERVRLPLSIRNDDARSVQLRLTVAGLPREWVILSNKLVELQPGQVTSIDIILQTQKSVGQSNIEAVIRLADRERPDVALMLPLQLVFKTAPNLTGAVEPHEIRDSRQTYLHLQNHTQTNVTVHLSAHTETNMLHVLLSQTQVEMPPGQQVKIPIRVSVDKRPWLKPVHYAFSISARHSTRAPLDYPAIVRVRTRIPLLPLVVVLLVIAALTAVLVLNRQGASVAPIATAPLQPTASPTVAQRASVTPAVIQPVLTQTGTASSLPTDSLTTPEPTLPFTATEAPLSIDVTPTTVTAPTDSPVFDDPRPDNCTEPIPPGWKPYTVQSGDRVFRLAVDSGTTAEEIMRVNCLSNPRLLQIGQVLLIPQP